MSKLQTASKLAQASIHGKSGSKLPQSKGQRPNKGLPPTIIPPTVIPAKRSASRNPARFASNNWIPNRNAP